MALSNDLVSQFVQVTKEEKQSKETTVYGTIVDYDGGKYVKLDGSELLTPISTTADALDGERVTVMIKNHTALVTGNISSPSARTDTVKEVSGTVTELGTQISEFEIIIADKVSTERLEAEIARIDTLVSENVTIKNRLDANEANINTLTADNATINEKLTATEAEIDSLDTRKLDAEIADVTYATIDSLTATNAKINNLEATYGDFETLTTEWLLAVDASIVELDTKKLDAESAEILYANIDFTNISEAAVTKIFSESGIIEDLVVSEGHITGELVGVTIKGDLIEGNTIKADKLVVKGSDGLYYKLNIDGGATTSSEVSEEELQNGLHGRVIIANTITAEKINVDDLVAFDATIGGFKITNSQIYSGVKESATNTTRGIYLDNDGQFSTGDSTNYLRYFKDSDGTYKLEISASSVKLRTSNSTEVSVGDALTNIQNSVDNIEIGGTNLIAMKNLTTNPNDDACIINGENTNNIEVTGVNQYFMSMIFFNKEYAAGEYTLNVVGSISGTQAIIVSNIQIDDSWSYNISYNYLGYGYYKYVNTPITFSLTETTKLGLVMNGNHGDQTLTGLKLEKGNKATDWSPAPEDVVQNIIDTTDEVRADMADQNASTLDSCNEMIDSALDGYVTNNEYDSFKQTVETEFDVLGDEITMNFTTVETTISELDGTVQAKFEEFNKHFSFSENGLSISAGENTMSIRVDNDIVVFEKAGIQFGWWDGIDFHTGNIIVDVNERAQFGSFAYVPRSDGSLSFLKVT